MIQFLMGYFCTARYVLTVVLAPFRRHSILIVTGLPQYKSNKELGDKAINLAADISLSSRFYEILRNPLHLIYQIFIPISHRV